jgi:hypothetical protein
LADQNFRVKRGLEVGLGATVLTALPSGFVGIGTTNPGATLNVVPTSTNIAGLFSGTTSSDMVRITQLGSGNALRVEDSANPDSSPFVITGSGDVGIAITNPQTALHLGGGGNIRLNRADNARSSIIFHDNTGFNINANTSGDDVIINAGNVSGRILLQNNSSTTLIAQSGTVLIGSASSTGTASQTLQVNSGAYFSGSVGIGTTNPTAQLQINSSTSSSFYSYRNSGENSAWVVTGDSNVAALRFQNSLMHYRIGIQGSTQLVIRDVTNTGNRVAITSTGEVLVNTTTATGTSSQPLQVSGGAYFNGNVGVGTTNPLDKLHVLGDFLVAAGSSTGQHITQKAYELNNGTMSWEGSAGQLFSITNNLTSGSIFSVNDVSGIPSIDVDANGTIALAPYGTTENVGVGTTSPTSKLTVEGNALITGILTATTGLGGDAFESYEIDLVPYTSYNLRTVATTITFDDSNTTDVALYGTIVELPIEDNDFIEDSTYIPYFDGEVVSITNPFKLMITVNGVLQSAFINNTDNVYQSNFLGSHNGYTIDSDNNIKFTESIPTGSDIVARVLPASSTATKIKNYPFKPTDIVLGY